ncbi:MAG: glycoside hydrolase, partial [Firmicutes bacterium]|nr:glycoside hydrolase [Bacillota bacterium]
MNFKNIPKEYCPIPFWSWNEKLNTDETAYQVRVMDKAGMGGFFMHARGGLQTEYMGDEWFSNIDAAANEAKKRGMFAWAYDENGWPSGFGDGKVNGLGIEYQQKYLRMSDIEPSENIITKCGRYWFYFDVNPFYVDVLDKKVIKKFIEVAYEPYYERYKNKIEGFFTDEPQISRNGIPWSFVFEEEYHKKYNENILDHLEELFLPVLDYKNTRVKFWKMVTDLFSSAFCKQIYDWCDKRNLKFTGHLVLEESLLDQLITNGACMPHYEYFHMPGMDWLGRPIYDCLTPKQVSSVAEQLGKDKVLSETFALCGHNVSFAELKGIYEWQMVHGINMLCQHLEGYSLRGIRKRDYPPA